VIIADDTLFTGRRPKDKKADWLLGPTYAANAALKKCKGRWIARNDDDDEWTPDHLERLLRFAQMNNYEYVSAAQKWIYPDGTIEIKTWQDDTGELNKFGGVQTSLFRAYLKFFKFDKNCWQKKWNANNDIDHPVRMSRAGVRMGFLDEIVTIVRPRPGETKIGLEALYEHSNS
jgi:glycosyltransferase involved in cell wall biosynthesis